MKTFIAASLIAAGLTAGSLIASGTAHADAFNGAAQETIAAHQAQSMDAATGVAPSVSTTQAPADNSWSEGYNTHSHGRP